MRHILSDRTFVNGSWFPVASRYLVSSTSSGFSLSGAAFDSGLRGREGEGGRRRTIELNKKGSLIVHSISNEYVMYRVLIVHPNGRTSCNAIECPSVVPCLSPAVVEG